MGRWQRRHAACLGTQVKAFLLTILLFTGVSYASAEEPLQSRPLVFPYQARAQQLEQELAKREAEIIGLRADLAVMQANTEQARRELQSLILTNDVAETVKKLQAAFPGTTWVWDNDTRRIVPVKPEGSKK